MVLNEFVARSLWRWTLVGGLFIACLGLFLVLSPVGSKSAFVRETGWLLMAAAAVEFAVGLGGIRSRDGRIAMLLSAVALGAALLILLRPASYPLLFVAITCLVARGVGAGIAAFIGRHATRYWLLGRGFLDLLLATILISGAPLSAVMTILSGSKWPSNGAALLGNFVALSMIASGLALAGIGLSNRPGRDLS